MAERLIRFAAGEIIFEEGSFDHKAYIIKQGRVQVYRKQPSSEDIILAEIGEGQIFGEMGLITERARSASVRAIEDVILEVIGWEEFSQITQNKPELLVPILRVVFERLRNTNAQLLKASLHIGHGHENIAPVKLVITGLTPKSKKILGNKELSVQKFPFKIGRKTNGFESDVLSNNDLYIEDSMPFNVSRNHLSINYASNQYFVLDRGSTLGTVVNGERLGGYHQSNSCTLEKEENEIILGNDDSPFRFMITIKKIG